MIMAESRYLGILMIGDPHLEGRQPGFRKDNYPEVILEKLAWCLNYAKQNQLLPVVLGDLFDKPRDNPNWMIVRLMDLLDQEVIGLYGNHDCADPVLSHHDSLSLLISARRLRLLTTESPWMGTIAGRTIVIGGSSYRQPIPDRFPCDELTMNGKPLVIWLTHHDLTIPGYDEGRYQPRELPGIDFVVNGHIHRRLETLVTGTTRWITPGNISRRKRGDATRDHVPSALRMDIMADDCQISYIEIPHRPFDEVFYDAVVETAGEQHASAFIAGLAELQARRTDSGAGLMQFLETNVAQFEPAVANEIMNLASEVTNVS
jgi:DNA repair exonuclease SbcCD nuclease subunit